MRVKKISGLYVRKRRQLTKTIINLLDLEKLAAKICLYWFTLICQVVREITMPFVRIEKLLIP